MKMKTPFFYLTHLISLAKSTCFLFSRPDTVLYSWDHLFFAGKWFLEGAGVVGNTKAVSSGPNFRKQIVLEVPGLENRSREVAEY